MYRSLKKRKKYKFSDFISKFELVRHKRLFCETISQTVREKRQEIETERLKEKRERIKKMKKRKPKRNFKIYSKNYSKYSKKVKKKFIQNIFLTNFVCYLKFK